MNNRIGPYEVNEQVGAGGMATVYRGYQPRLDRSVAIKVMHQMLMQDPNYRARFEREARIIARLDHPSIVPIYDYDTQDGQPYLVMKFIQGKTLKDVLAEGTLPLEAIRGMMRQIADALTYAHEEGVLHRDIKPSNILIDENGHPYLTDFGLARIASQGESTMSVDTMVGTPQYVSPEQAQGNPDLDAHTDIYSLAVILYELVAGRVPFSGEHAYAIIHKQIYAAPPAPSELNPEVPPEVDRVLLRALDKDPAQRYHTPNELIAAFEGAITRSGLTHLDDSRVQVAAERGEMISERTPAGGKYVSISMDFGDIPVQEVLQKIGGRFKEVASDLGEQLKKSEFVQDLAADIRASLSDSQQHNKSSIRVPAYKQDASRMIARDWGTDERSVRRRVEKRVEARRSFFIHLIIYLIVMALNFGGLGNIREVVSEGLSAPETIEAVGGTYLSPLATINFALVIALLWGAGVIEHGLRVFYTSGRWLERRRRELQNSLVTYYGDDWENTIDGRDYRRLRREVENHYNGRLGLITHFFWFVMISAVAWLVWPAIQASIIASEVQLEAWGVFLTHDFMMPVMITLLGAATVFFHAIGVMANSAFGPEARTRMMRRELQREHEIMARYNTTKAKNDADKRKNDLDDSLISGRMAEDGSRSPGVRLTGDGEFTESFIEEVEKRQRSS
ncbi:MAG: hypothetical protein OHK0046_15080 [Anaerolineae bacterium]